MGTIIKNSAKCKICGDIIESVHRHDFVQCKCGRISIDGGKDYLKRSFVEIDDLEDLSIVKDEEPNKSIKKKSGIVW